MLGIQNDQIPVQLVLKDVAELQSHKEHLSRSTLFAFVCSCCQDCTTDRTIIEYMTDGMLLRSFLLLASIRVAPLLWEVLSWTDHGLTDSWTRGM